MQAIADDVSYRLFEQINGYRYQVIATSTRGGQAPAVGGAASGVRPTATGSSAAARTAGWPSHWFTRSIPPGYRRRHRVSTLLCWRIRRLLLDGPVAKAETETLRCPAAARATHPMRHSRYVMRLFTIEGVVGV